MPEPITFTVPGVPSPKKRPRVVRLPSGESHTYTPDEAGFVPKVQVHALEAGIRPYDGIVVLKATVYRSMPAAWSSKRRTERCGLPCTAGPDRVNVMANLCDALEGVAYANDRQVQLDFCWSFWAESDATVIEVRTL